MTDFIPTSEPTEADVLFEAIRAKLATIHTELPGVVVGYDSTTKLASVRPIIRFRRWDPDLQEEVLYQPPIIPNVPVKWPASSAGALTMPLSSGDVGIIRWQMRSIDEWRTLGGDDVTPAIKRMFDYGDAVFDPGVQTGADSLPAAAFDATNPVLYAATLLLLGDNTATDFVALGSLVDIELGNISADLAALGGSYVPAGSVAATKVKAV